MESTQPTFHETYAELTAGLPPSQLREAHKRLSRCKQPLTDEEIAGEHPRVQACLERIAAAYARKKVRSAVASKARRDAAREATARLAAGDVAESRIDTPLTDETAPVAAFEACTIEVEPEPTTDTPAAPLSGVGDSEVDVEACDFEADIDEADGVSVSEPAPSPTAPLACQPTDTTAPLAPASPVRRAVSRGLVRSAQASTAAPAGTAKKSGNSLVRRR